MSKTARADSFHILHTLVCCCFHLGIMALGLVRSSVELLTCGRGIIPVRGFHQLACPLLYRLALMLVFGLCVWKWTSSVTTLDPNQRCSIGFDCSASVIAQSLACTRKLGKCRSSEGLRSFNPSKGTNLLILIILAGDIEMNPGPRSQCRLCKKYCKASEKSVKCEECEKRFHTSCISLDEKELLELESGNGSWYCTNCKADCTVYVVVLFYMVTKQSNVTNVKCGFTINAPLSQNLNWFCRKHKLHLDLSKMRLF